MEEQAELIKYSAKTKSNLLKTVAICNKYVNEKKRNSLKTRNNHQNLEN